MPARSILTCLLLVAVSCATTKAATDAPAPDDKLRARDFYPLKVGNRWTYEIRAQGQKVRRTVEIVSEKDGYFLDSQNGRYKHDATGLRDANRYLMQNPLETGHKWMSVLSLQSTERFEVTDAGAPCTTIAGTFGQCVTVKAENMVRPGQTLILESTYAQGVGLVHLRTLQQVKDTDPALQMELELVSYELAP